MSKSFWAIIAVIVVIFGGILVFNGNDAKAPDGSTNSKSSPTEHVYSEGTTGVTLIEYGDYQCPYCAQFHPVVNQVKEKYKGQITYKYRNLPLTSAHQNAFAAARAAEAADKQGKFWEMQDIIYENQAAWATEGDVMSIFNQYAARLNLDVTKFKKDATSSAVNNLINADIKDFEKLGIDKSTPTFILDGKRIQPDSFSVDAFAKFIDPAIQKKTSGQAGQN